MVVVNLLAQRTNQAQVTHIIDFNLRVDLGNTRLVFPVIVESSSVHGFLLIINIVVEETVLVVRRRLLRTVALQKGEVALAARFQGRRGLLLL